MTGDGGAVTDERVRLEVDGPIAVLTIDDPTTRNGLTAELARDLIAHCRTINDDLGIRAAILTAAGSVFCAGGNLKDMYARRHHFAGTPAEIRRYYENGVQNIARALYGLEVPIVAAVNGPAMGAGFDFALMCDIRIASTRAKFAESFIKLGLVSAAGGSWFLQRAVGPAIAAELAMTGETIDAETARGFGIVSRVVEPDALMDTAFSIARSIARHPAHSIRLNKRVLRDSATLGLEQALSLAAAAQAVVQSTEDQHEAVSAVVEKREPIFKGR